MEEGGVIAAQQGVQPHGVADRLAGQPPGVGRAAASVGPDDRAVRVGDQQLRLSTDDEAGIR